jgi:hypothetical protein
MYKKGVLVFRSFAISTVLALSVCGSVSAHDFHIQPSQPGLVAHPYPTTHHYCPYGTQPVSVAGEVSCGVPSYPRPVVVVVPSYTVVPTYEVQQIIIQPGYSNVYQMDTRPVSTQHVTTPGYCDRFK